MMDSDAATMVNVKSASVSVKLATLHIGAANTILRTPIGSSAAQKHILEGNAKSSALKRAQCAKKT